MKYLKSIIKKYYPVCIALLCILGLGIVHIKEISFLYHRSSAKKKILVLTSSGGGGNLEASNAIQAHLDKNYEIQLCHVFKEILAPLDPFNTITFKKYSSEEIYNHLLPGKHFTLLNWIYQLGRWYTQSQKEKIFPLLQDYFIQTQPDLIISVIPVINNIVLEVAQELNIPFLLIPTDLDATVYTADITDASYEKFYVGLIFDDPEIKTPFEKAHITNNKMHLLGAPLRPDFLTKKNKTTLRKHYNIEKNKPVIMILMGAQGSNEIKKYVKSLLTINKPCHLIICVGKNEESAKDLAKVSFPEHISASIVGFTPHIADYMALSDLLITKSGTLSVCESLYMNLPLFLDATSTLLPWEKFNHEFIKKYNLGTSIENFKEIAPLIGNAIEQADELTIYKKNIKKLEKRNFEKELKKLAKKILSTK